MVLGYGCRNCGSGLSYNNGGLVYGCCNCEGFPYDTVPNTCPGLPPLLNSYTATFTVFRYFKIPPPSNCSTTPTCGGTGSVVIDFDPFLPDFPCRWAGTGDVGGCTVSALVFLDTTGLEPIWRSAVNIGFESVPGQKLVGATPVGGYDNSGCSGLEAISISVSGFSVS